MKAITIPIKSAATSLNWPKKRIQVDELTVIAKVSERCNLACPYCYYFYMGDDSFAGRPAVMSEDVAKTIVDALDRFVDECAPRKVSFVFHGGEPMLMKLSRFDSLCQRLRDVLGAKVSLSLGIQTNGAHMTNGWIEAFHKHNVGVGVSLDGPPQYQNASRPTTSGKDSYELVRRSVNLLRKAKEAGKIKSLGTISVLNDKHNVDLVFDHIADELGISQLNFLLPDGAAADPTSGKATALAYGNQLCTLFDRWTTQPDLYVREIHQLLSHFQAKKNLEDGAFTRRPDLTELRTSSIIVIQSDGSLSIDDSLIPTGQWRRQIPSPNVSECTINHFLSHPAYDEIQSAINTIPSSCKSCKWRMICRGGRIEDRYRADSGFDNPSVHCEGLKTFYEHVVTYLTINGYPESALEVVLRTGELDTETQENNEESLA